MKKKWLAVIGAVLVLGVVGLTGCGDDGLTLSGGSLELKGNLYNQQEGIWVNGEGRVAATPDVAIISLGVEAQETTVQAAQAAAAQAMDNVLQTLKDQGVAEEDIQTQYFNISRVTRWDSNKQEETLIGFRVTHTVSAKVRDIDNAGPVIDAVVAAGGDLTRINGISLTIDDPSGFQEQARVLAVQDAAAKAAKLAETAGVTLGEVTYITESSYIPGPVYRDSLAVPEAGGSAQTTISPGEMEVTVNVQLIYAIGN